MKLAIVSQRYGLEVNGGAEYYSRLLAEHLAKYHEVEVLTTKAMDHGTWKNVYVNDIETINGITVRRFYVKRERTQKFALIDKIVRNMPWKSRIVESAWIKEQGPYVPSLVKYINNNKNSYDLFLFVTYLYYPTAVGMKKVRDKAILIPTAHDETYIYMNFFKKNFSQARGIIYLTNEEKYFVQNLFHNEDISNQVVGVGVDVSEDISERRFRRKYNISKQYLIYVGRVEESKGCKEMFKYFEKMDLPLELVVLGKNHMLSELPENEHIHMLGFVSEEDKMDAIKGAVALVLPSSYESLSIAVLEAMSVGTPIIVNGQCEVLKGHCERSGVGKCFYNEESFIKCVKEYLNCDRDCISRLAKEYIEKNYTWEKVEKCYVDFLERI